MGMPIAALVVAIAIFYLVFAIDKKAERFLTLRKNPQSSSGVSVSVTTGSDEYEYPIKGINMNNVNDDCLGDFAGYVRALTGNTHDPYAIGVYVRNRRVGYLPRGNKSLHARLLAAGGSADAVGYIAKARDENDGHEFYYGFLNVVI
jgi:hypothetical protein